MVDGILEVIQAEGNALLLPHFSLPLPHQSLISILLPLPLLLRLLLLPLVLLPLLLLDSLAPPFSIKLQYSPWQRF